MNELDLSILKTLVTNKKHALDFVNECDDKLFDTSVWNFANIIVNYLRTYKELPTLRVLEERLTKQQGLSDMVKRVWGQIDQLQYNDKEFKYDLERLKKRYAEKQVLTLRDNLIKVESGGMDMSRVMGEIQKTTQNIKSLHQVKTFERRTLKDAVPLFREEYNAKLKDPTFDRGIMTYYSFIDQVTDGFRPGELIMIGGESGGGKSMLLMNMAIQIWLQQNTMETENFGLGYNILYFSLEMPFKPCLNRVLARLSTNPSKAIRGAKLNPFEAEKLKKALKFVQRYPYQFEIIDIPRGATMETIEMLYEEALAYYRPDVVVIDYLGLMDYEGEELEDWLKLGKISEKAHEFARVHHNVVLSALQLNRPKGTKEEDKIGLHRIGRSSLIMNNGNIGIQIETRHNEKSYPDMLYHIIKNRDGELGKGRLLKNLACGTLIDDAVVKPGEEDDTVFPMRDPDDISEKIELLDI